MNLSHEQLAAVHATEKHVVVASVAGSGKSRVIVERIRYVISQGTDPQRICMVTFTVTAAKEIQNRLGDVRLGYAGTLHGLLLKAIRHSPHLVGYSTQPSVLNEEAAETMLEEAAKESRWTGSLEELRKAAARTIRKKGALSKLEAAAVHYQQKLVDAGLVDYDGILRLGLEMAYSEEFPFKFDHLLVDESQDSAAIDFEIYDAMSVENTFMVGDPNQRIFSFRGSSDGFEKMCSEATR